MLSVLLIYRTEVFKQELREKIIKYNCDIITLVVENNTAKLIIIKMLERSNINTKNITIYTINQLIKGKLKKMKFDYILGNPPYHKIVGDSKTDTIWDTIIVKCFNLLKENGKMTMVHPGGWRFATKNSKGNIKKVKNIYSTNEVTYAKFNDIKQGQKTFTVSTDYDVLTVIKNNNPKPINVITKSENITINFSDYDIIPTDKISMFNKFKAKLNEKKVEILYSTSAYEIRKDIISTSKDLKFKYPVVYGFPLTKGLKLIYSHTSKNGHFGITKLIIVKASPYSLIDLKGEYGMSQYAGGIVDTPENLFKIQKVIETNEFKALKGVFCGIGNSINKSAIIDAPGTMFKFIKSFKKDWWKELYTPEMELELIFEGVLDSKGNYIG